MSKSPVELSGESGRPPPRPTVTHGAAHTDGRRLRLNSLTVLGISPLPKREGTEHRIARGRWAYRGARGGAFANGRCLCSVARLVLRCAISRHVAWWLLLRRLWLPLDVRWQRAQPRELPRRRVRR